MAFHDGEEYRPYRDSRIAGAVNELTMIAGRGRDGSGADRGVMPDAASDCAIDLAHHRCSCSPGPCKLRHR
jgi:hypothetical protein